MVTVAPDNAALTIMVGNAGFPYPVNPTQYIVDNLLRMQVLDLRVGPGRTGQPFAGCQQGFEHDVSYVVNGTPCMGVATCSIASGYGMNSLVMTAALAQQHQWPRYATWLPRAAATVSVTSGAAFGGRGVMQQNLQNSIAEGQRQQEYRDWSARNWSAVVQQRWDADERHNFDFRENLGAVHTYVNPYDPGHTIELPTTYEHYWVNRRGEVVGTDDPCADPNVGGTDEWTLLPRYRP